MASFLDKKGVQIISPFKYHSEQPLDLRETVETIAERDELVTAHAAFAGLRVFVKQEKKSYIYNGETWDLLTTAQLKQSSLTITLNNGKNEGMDKFTFDGSESKTINISPSTIGASTSDHSHNVASNDKAGYMPALPSDTNQFLRSDGTWATPPDNDTTYEIMTGSTTSDNGSSGLVPIPLAGEQDYVLFADGTWKKIPSKASGVSTPRNINGMSIDLTADRFNYSTCNTAADTAAKVVTCNGFELATGAHIDIKFIEGNTAENATLNINDSGPKRIYYNGDPVVPGDIQEGSVISLRYDGTNWCIVGCLSMKVTTAPNPYALKFTGAVTDSYDGSTEKTINIPENGNTPNSMVIRFDSGDTEDSTKFTFNGSTGKDINITPSSIGAAAIHHNHDVASTADAGFMPAINNDTDQYLRGDGTWATPPNNNTTYDIMGAATETTGGKAGLVPAPAAGAQGKYLRGDGTWETPPDTNTTYSVMSGATTSAAGKAGLVPAPTSGAANRYLRSDGTWQVPPDTNTTYTALKNPYKIKFTGAVTAEYDGSAERTINIPSSSVVAAPVGTVLFSTNSSATFFNSTFGGTWEVVGNLDAAVGISSSITLYMFKKTAL